MNNTTTEMTNKPIKTTGRKFRCIGLEESNCLNWNHNFEIGEEYFEAKHDASFEDNTDKHQLLLVYKKLYPFYVDKTQFKLLVKV